MKFSESWLREFVNPELDTQALVDQLTMAGLEVDGFEPVASKFSGIVVGEILTAEKHPNADKLKLCTVSGGDEIFQVVCGAPNARPGIKVPFALVGAILTEEGQKDFKIKKAKLRGVESFGMLCSEKELGLSENHEGLMELPADAVVGENIRDYLKLDDNIIDLDLTPNRSDCLGMIGLARETGLLNGLDVKALAIDSVAPSIDENFEVRLEAGDACPRFVGRIIRGINLNAKTPLWMKEKLRRSEIRSIDPVVDVTNYVMLELGQPMHAYDLSKLQAPIIVRQAKQGELVKLLDDKDIKLNENTLLITDKSGPIGIAGIMGGLSTSVTETTTDIFLESAFFAPLAMAGRSRSYGMSTDASHRFERGVDWCLQARAIERATALLLEIAGGEAGPTTETILEAALPKINDVTLRLDRIGRLLGVEIEAEKIDEMLQRLGFEYTQAGQGIWQIKAPSHRFDIEIEADLIEEISRIYGYNNLPVRTPKVSLNMAPVNEAELPEQLIKHHLVSRGYQEAITYSFVDPKIQAIIDPEEEPIALANPISNDMGVMRTTLWSGLLKALMHNLNRQQSRVRLFETGLRFRKVPNKPLEDMKDVSQEKMIAGIATGPKRLESWNAAADKIDFYDIKGDIESLFNLSGQPGNFKFEVGSHAALHPGQTAKVTRDGEIVGFIGLLDPRVMQKLDLEQDVYVFEFKLAAIMGRDLPKAAPMSKFPEVRRDIAIIIEEAVSAASITDCVEAHAGEYFRNLKLFDVYRGKGIDPNRKSLAMGLTFQHASRTLTDDEINKYVDEVVVALAKAFDATLRN